MEALRRNAIKISNFEFKTQFRELISPRDVMQTLTNARAQR